MLISRSGTGPCLSGDVSQNPPAQRQVRRGATALEYLVCISTIIVVVIVTVQHLGGVASGMFSNSVKATAAMGS